MPTLTVKFDSNEVELINEAKQKVIIVQEVFGGDNQVIWASFLPFESNIVQWSSSYYLYVSDTKIEKYNTIKGLSSCSAIPEKYYQVDNSLTFQEVDSKETSNAAQYNVINNVDYDKFAQLTFGLAQKIIINNEESSIPIPLSAISLLTKNHTSFSPTNKILIYLDDNLSEGMIYNKAEFPQFSFLPLYMSSLTKKHKLTRRQLLKLTALTATCITPNLVLAESAGLIVDFNNTEEITVKYSSAIGKFIKITE